MTRFFSLLLTLLLGAGVPALAQSPLPSYAEAQTPKGQDFWYIDLPDAERISVQIFFPNDWGHRSAESVGTALIGPNLLYVGGAGDLDARRLANAIQDLSAFSEVRSGTSGATFSLALNPGLAEEGARLTNKVLADPKFDSRWLTREVRQAKVDAEKPLFDPAAKAAATLTHLYYPGLPIGTLLRRDEARIYDLVTPDLLRAWHQDTFHLGNAIPIIAGPLSQDEAARLVDILLSDVPRSAPARVPLATPLADLRPAQIFLSDPDQTNALTRFWLEGTAGTTIADRAALDLAGRMFASGGLQAPLFEALRTELRATYGFFSGAQSTSAGQTYLSFGGEVDPDVVALIPQISRETLEAYRQEGPDADSLQIFVDRMTANLPAQFRSASSVVAALGRSLQNHGATLDEAMQAFLASGQVTQEQALAALQTQLPGPENLGFLLLGAEVPEGFEGCLIQRPMEAATLCR